MVQIAETPKTGCLSEGRQYGRGSWAETYYECVDCGTSYPWVEEWTELDELLGWHASGNRAIKCNGQTIAFCPWCRPDSEAGKNGR